MKRLSFEERRALIISAAVHVANEDGFASLSHVAVSKACAVDTSERTVRSFFSMADLRRIVALDERTNEAAVDTARHMGIVR